LKKNKNEKYRIPSSFLLAGLIALIVGDHPDWGTPIAIFFVIFSFIYFIIVGTKKDDSV
jgi:uncharacterized MAPEG superfamily protein